MREICGLGRAEDRAKPKAEGGAEPQAGQLGLRLRALTREERAQAHVGEGLLIEGVFGPSARAGLQPGDVLLSINGVPVSSVDQVRAALERKPKGVALLIDRGGDRLFVPVELD